MAKTIKISKKVANVSGARTSKYVGNTYSGWLVTGIKIKSVAPKNSRRPGHRNYSYTAMRLTSDGKFDKNVVLNGSQMKKLASGTFDIEAYADKNTRTSIVVKRTVYAFK